MELIVLPGKSAGGMARIWFMPGYHRVHVRWYCMEMMLKANVAGWSNGEQAFWINGKLIAHFKNIIWRHTNDLKINSFLLGLYIHDNKKVNRMWYDDVIVSTGYIGL